MICTHTFDRPHAVVGGFKENPGVVGHGGGTVTTEVCRHCGLYRVTDTWDPVTNSPGESVIFRQPDDKALAYVRIFDVYHCDALPPLESPTTPGMYLRLFHGRKPGEQLDDWGSNGPSFGPLKWFHTTYASHVRCAALGDDDDTLEFRMVDGMLEYDGIHYGDWSAFVHGKEAP